MNILRKQIFFCANRWQGNQIYLLGLPYWIGGGNFIEEKCARNEP